MNGESKIKFNTGKLLSGIIYPPFFPLFKEDTVLNIGCGEGQQAIIYKDAFKRMVGIDINQSRLNTAKILMEQYVVKNFGTICANVENIPLDEKFDKAIAIDIIEHVINPERAITEIHRLLKEGGKLLITFPAMHDKYEAFFRFVGRKILRRKGKTVKKEGWDPDAHQYIYSIKEWLNMMKKGGFKLIDSRASTLFPPLHYLGLPRIWFSNKFIHAVDDYLCKLPFLKNHGQALVCIFEKNKKT